MLHVSLKSRVKDTGRKGRDENHANAAGLVQNRNTKVTQMLTFKKALSKTQSHFQCLRHRLHEHSNRDF